jgi:hypothetical protein
VAWVDGELLLEAHPPVDAEGQSFEPDLDQFADLLRKAVGDSTVAIHWDYAREVLQKANGVIATVGLEADLSQETPAPAAETPAAPAEMPAANQPAAGAPAPGEPASASPNPESPTAESPAPESRAAASPSSESPASESTAREFPMPTSGTPVPVSPTTHDH